MKDEPQLEGIEAKFQQDPLKGFGGKGIFIIDSLVNRQPRTKTIGLTVLCSLTLGLV